VNDNYQDASLILVGHGSTLNADSAGPTFQHAENLRARKIFRHVLESFWKQEPYVWSILRQTWTPRVFVVPLFISEGYFTQEVIPRELGLTHEGASGFSSIQKRGNQTIFYTAPVGTHPSMNRSLLARAEEVVTQSSPESTPGKKESSLFIVGHGTGNNENSRAIIEHQVRLIREQDIYRDVHAIYMEESPRVGECYQMAETENLVVVPFFISDGLHSFEDIPMMLGESEENVRERLKSGRPTWINPSNKNGKKVWYSSSIGNEPHIAEVILERVSEMGRQV